MASVLQVVLSLIVAIVAAATWSFITRVSGINPLPSNWPPTPKRQGVFARNTILQGLEKIGVGKLPGPEDIAIDRKGRLYTGCADGWIKRVSPETGEVENWKHIGGHPLGIKFGIHGELLVCEPTQGLLNVTEDKIDVLSNEADGLKYMLTDILDVAKDGIIYFTDASHKFSLDSFQKDFLEGRPNGRLLKYDPSSRTTTVLLKDLYFANGVALSSKEDFLVVCETAMVRCLKYWLEGEKRGTTEIFIDNLPGLPDNIKHNGQDIFWLALISDRGWFSDVVMKIAPLKHILALLPGILDKLTPSKMAKVVAVNEAGEAVAFYEDPTGDSIAFLTTALPVGDHLYLGNLGTSYIGKVKIQVSSNTKE